MSNSKYNSKVVASPKLDAASAQKGTRRVLFSTPQPPRKVDNGIHFLSAKKEVPPPYTPANCFPLNTHIPPPAPIATGRPVQQLGHMRMGAVFPAGSHQVDGFKAVMAASEALRINLGLDGGQSVTAQVMMPFASPPVTYGLFGSPREVLAQMPGAPVVPPPSVYNKTPSTSVQTQLMSSLFPVTGQVQPAVSQSAALPPM
jgi:hypothetical protein